jgi:heat shock protein HspQ
MADVVRLQAEREARLQVGQIVRHLLFDYRGVIYDVDPTFGLSEAWYEQMARTRPPKDQPWYRVLVDGAEHTTYVAERNLEPDASSAPVRHPMLTELFSGMQDGRYVRITKAN